MLPSLDDRRRLQEGPPRSCNDLEESLQSELELILHAQRQRSRQVLDRERDLNIYRSGSAPPTVEGSFSAVGSLFRSANNNNNNNNFGGTGGSSGSGGGGNTGRGNNLVLSEDELRLHPAYLSYYYSNDNINPRLPPPLLSKEDWRVAQRFQATGGSYFGGIGDWRSRNEFVDERGNSSLFSTQPAVLIQNAESDLDELRNAIRSNNLSKQSSGEWLDRGSDGLIGLQGPSLGSRRKSFADIVQEGLDQSVSLSGHLSHPASRNAIGASELHAAVALSNGMESMDGLHSTAAPPGFSEIQSHGSSISPSLAMGSSLSRSTTPEQHLIGRAPGSALPPVGGRVGPEKNSMMTLQNGHSSGMSELDEIAAALSGLSMSKIRHPDQENHLQAQLSVSVENQPDFLLKTTNGQTLQQHLMDRSRAQDFPLSSNYIDVARKNGVMPNFNAHNMGANGEISIPKRTSSSANLHSKMNRSGLPSLERLDLCHQNASIPSVDFTGRAGAYAVNQKPHSAIKNYLEEGGSGIEHDFNRLRNQLGSNPQSPITDQQYSQYLQKTSDFARGASAPQFRNSFGTSNGDLDMIQKAYVEGLLAQQKQQYELPLLGKSPGPGQGYYRNPSHSLHMPYPGNSMENCMLPSVGSGSFQNERVPRFSSVPRSSMGASIGLFHSDASNDMERRYTSSLLDEFKNNKTKFFELTDIVDHVVEFSTDQFGSRFIQQKLETATVEGKNKIFPEIIPHARTLMTDVFGNYVIQKFFEHGTENQRRELASQLTGHVLPLSLQMYGCRVIQKALEVVDVGQQTQMVTELDGSIMKCVRDQNGNHVIQKCIECVPEDRIQFIISSFYGQVVPLSTHPYGCRVIQRVLEHCHDMKTQQIIMDEILQSVCTLAQDQYGNYVIQHVLEHGKLHERSAIISKLAGQIVKMSQQKFASNVVEKCLTFGGPEERQLLVNEMLGSTDENEPLQAMMKDPFGNYVVQKVLETCDDQSLQLILSRIKVHLNTLKRYTYGKHIVSRVEKLIAAGERRIGLSSSLSP